jgi:hypothetical protein
MWRLFDQFFNALTPFPSQHRFIISAGIAGELESTC